MRKLNKHQKKWLDKVCEMEKDKGRKIICCDDMTSAQYDYCYFLNRFEDFDSHVERYLYDKHVKEVVEDEVEGKNS
jgi:hypothetical protein